MMDKRYLLIVIPLISLLVIGYSIMSGEGADRNRQQAPSGDSIYRAISSGTVDSGDVSIELEPTDVSDDSITVRVSINTHSVDLGRFDLLEMTTLEYDGKNVRPSSGPALSGHHVYGTLVFDTDEKPESFSVRIEGMPKVQERIFSW